jgi:hypothetical protein
MLTMDKFTPMERRIVELLRDGLPHSVTQCIASMGDVTATYQNLQPHISVINKKIRPHGYEIAFVKANGRMCYRIIRPISSSVVHSATHQE